jgi:RNase adaptor protein for sRNA GlmZ degradation
MQTYLKGSLGLVIDGTGKDYTKITGQADKLKDLGYDVAMIFVNTDIETALQRNKDRPRSIPDEEVNRMWSAVQNNIGRFQNYFKQAMYIIDSSEGGVTDEQTTKLFVQLGKWAKQAGSRRTK